MAGDSETNVVDLSPRTTTQAAGADGAPASVHSFQKRRTYADACRERGIENIETLRLEVAEMRASMTTDEQAAAKELARKQAEQMKADALAYRRLVSLQGEDTNLAATAIVERHGAIMEAFIAAGLGAEWLPMAMKMMLTTDMPATAAASVFATCTPSPAPNTETPEPKEERRFNGQGLISR